MKFLRLLLNFSTLSDKNLLGKALLVIRNLTTGAPASPPPVPLITELQDATDTFSKDLGNSVDGSKNAIAVKNNSRAELVKVLVKMAIWVMSDAGNNVLPLEQSGFTLVKVPQPRYIKPAAEVVVTNGVTTGQIIIIGKKDKAATGYQFMISFVEPTEATAWTVYSSSRSKYVVNDLKRGSEVYVRYAVIGARNQIAYSNIVSHIVQ